jgi:uncharacterized SAM-binding protein YcdF (DUF218 family)/lysophospholipase L1-like esterase
VNDNVTTHRNLVNTIARWRFIAGLLLGVALVFAVRLLINETTFPDRIVAPLLLADTSGPADTIVVMGAAVVGDCIPNKNGVRRVLLGTKLWRERRAPVMLFTGGRAEGACPVADAMATLARETGVPAARVYTETGSLTTRENGELSALLLRRLGARRLLVVTDRLHMRRAAGTFRELGFAVEQASVPVYEGHDDNVEMLTAAFREFAAVGYYRARGWLGSPSPAREAPVGTAGLEYGTGNGMHGDVKNDGPVVLLGASYAKGWNPRRVAGADVVNKGIAGQQSFEMLARFDSDVVANGPRAVILWGFINDIFRAGDAEQALKRAQESYVEMIARARQNGIEPILATEVTVRPPNSWSETLADWAGWVLRKEGYQHRVNKHVIAMNQWLVDLARREKLLVLDFQSTLAEAGGRRRREFSQDDGSHISERGYEVLTTYAAAILETHLASQRSGS